ncbi:MAG TPA: hypothetical protein VEI97_04730, partial [bacterium]|nr:hypothetical protein [bacterium]
MVGERVVVGTRVPGTLWWVGQHVTAVVAPNGVGHLRRVVGVLHTLSGRRPDLRIDVICADWQLRHLEGWDRARALWEAGARPVTGLMEPGVTWSPRPEVYADGRLLEWESRLADSGLLDDADLVLSDNLGGVLSLRPDAVLMGSFLWSDVLAAAHPDDPAVTAFVGRERSLLASHRPPMLCVGDMAMPGVLARSDAVPLPWMPQSPPLPPIPGRSDRGRRVAVLGGRTGVLDELLARVATSLSEAGLDVAVPEPVPQPAHRPAPEVDREGRLQPFGFTAADFASSDVVVCRPGVGTVTDCVGQRVPMVVLHEAGNVELAHNAARLADMGVARNAGGDPPVEAVLDSVRAVLGPEARTAMKGR